MASSIYGMLYDELEAIKKHKPEEFEQFAEGFDALDREAIGDIILDGETFWFEWSRYSDISESAIYQMLNYIKRKGYTYLYDAKEAE